MKQILKVTVNKPNVVFDTIEGETVLLDLKSGNFFTLEGSGSAIMQYILEYGDWRTAIAIMKEANHELSRKITLSVNRFMKTLMEEKILVPADHVPVAQGINDLVEKLKAAARGFIPPKLNKHSDVPYLAMTVSTSIYMVSSDLCGSKPVQQGWPEGIVNPV